MNKLSITIFITLTIKFYANSRKLPNAQNSDFGSGCKIDINTNLPDPQPLLINPGTNTSILPATPDGVLRLKHRQSLELFCTEGFKLFSNSKSVKASCLLGNNVEVNGKAYDIYEMKCQKSSKPFTKNIGKCYKNSDLIHIGYNMEKRFLKLIEICFDKHEERTLYAHAKLTKANAAHQKNVDRGSWIAGKGYFTNSNVNKLYSVANQFERAKKMLGAGTGKKFVNNKLNLARGHLAPMVDFVYGVHQRATMHLLNAAPQWNKINGGNWFKIEESIRELLEKGDIDKLDVYSGTYGTLELNKKPFHLAVNEDGDGVMPVPKIFYKVVVHGDKGVVLIMTNDPFVTENNVKQYIYCNDVQSKLQWVRKMNSDLSKGYYYACTVDDFMKVVKHLPSEVANKDLLVG